MEIGRELGLSGWVKNRPDGIVELAAGGDSAALAKLEAAVAAGPGGARVDEVRKLAPASADSFEKPFAIVR
jgi:acylphosphatase